jgi:hypothetical protein
VRKSKGSTVMPGLVVCLAGMVVAGVCGPSQAGSATQNLLDEINKAGRLCGRAASELSAPSSMILTTGVISPEAVEPNKIDPNKIRSVSPKVLSDLAQARGGLSKALDQSADADADTAALARDLLARIDVLGGIAAQTTAADAGRRLRARLDQVEIAVQAVKRRSGVIGFYNQLAAVEDPKAAQMLKDSEGEKTKVEAAIAKATGEAAALKTKITDLQTEVTRMNADAVRLRQESDKLRGDEMLKKFQEALRVQMDAGEKSRQVAQSEEALRELQDRIKQDQVDLDFANQKIEMAKALVQKDQQARDALKKDQDKRQSALDEAQASLKTAVTEAAKEADAVKEAQKDAEGSFRSALARLEGKEPASRFAAQADVNLRLANLGLDRLNLGARLARLAGGKEVELLFPSGDAGSPAAKLRGYVGGAAEEKKLKDAADTCFKEAVRLYEEAVKKPEPPEAEWIYQGQLGAAYVGKYRLSGKPDDLADALKQFDAALGKNDERMHSPYLSPVVSLRMVAEGYLSEEARAKRLEGRRRP